MRGGGPIKGDLESIKKEFTEVLTKARGEQGAILRKNAEEVAAKLRMEKDESADAVIKELASI